MHSKHQISFKNCKNYMLIQYKINMSNSTEQGMATITSCKSLFSFP